MRRPDNSVLLRSVRPAQARPEADSPVIYRSEDDCTLSRSRSSAGIRCASVSRRTTRACRAVADHSPNSHRRRVFKADLQRIVDSAKEELKAIRAAAVSSSVRQSKEARVINTAPAFAFRRVESTVRQLHVAEAVNEAGAPGELVDSTDLASRAGELDDVDGNTSGPVYPPDSSDTDVAESLDADVTGARYPESAGGGCSEVRRTSMRAPMQSPDPTASGCGDSSSSWPAKNPDCAGRSPCLKCPLGICLATGTSPRCAGSSVPA